MTTLGQTAISLYIPAFAEIARDLQISHAEVKSTLTAFFLGYGLCQLFYGPISDRYGRKPVLLFGIALFCLSCIANLFVHSLSSFLLARFIQGIGAGSVITIGRSILLDSFTGKELISASSHLSMGFAIGTGISPIVGAYVLTLFGWRGDFFVLLLIGILLFLLIFLKLPETAPKLPSTSPTLHHFAKILSDLTFWKYLVGGVLAYSVVIAWTVLTPFLILGSLGYSPDSYGWMSLFIAIAYYLGAHFNRSLVHKFHLKKIFFAGVFLIGLSGLALLLAPGTLLFILIPMFIATCGQALIFSNTIASALANYPHLPGKASALFSSLQMLLASLISAFFSFLPDQPLTLGLVLIALALLILPLVALNRRQA